MLTHWNDLHSSLFGDLRSEMDRMFSDFRGLRAWENDIYEGVPSRGALPVDIVETKDAFVVTASVPSLRDKDLTITLHENVLTIAGERKSDAPEGYKAHRQERASYKFSRSIGLPGNVDAEKTTAAVKDGVLTIELTKVQAPSPRQIVVKTPS